MGKKKLPVSGEPPAITGGVGGLVSRLHDHFRIDFATVKE
jgi:hypothetical protein